MSSIMGISWNVQSIRNKCADVMEHVLDHDASIVFVSETWMEADKNDITALIKTYGYTLIHNRRTKREKETGGGVGVMVKSSMVFKHLKCKFYSSFEVTMVNLKLTSSTKLVLVTIYRLQYIPAATFMKEFSDLLEVLSVMPEDFVLSGDVNFHLETCDYQVELLRQLWESFQLTQHVHGPTHKLGHTLDLVLVRDGSMKITDVLAEDVQLSDHFMISFALGVEVLKHKEKTITYRNFNSIDNVHFSTQLKLKLESIMQGNFGERVHNYNCTMKNMVNEFAPLQTKVIKVVPNAPWFDSEYRELRKARRKAEKKYKRTKLQSDKEVFVSLRKQTTNMAIVKKRSHCSEKIKKCQGTKALFGCVNELLDLKKPSVLPTHESKFELATRFNAYFKDKISEIRKAFPPYKADSGHKSNYAGSLLETFKPTTEDEIRSLIKAHGIKCSPEDPMPAPLVKTVVDTLIPIWIELINLSLEQGSMDCLKCGVLAPLIKSLESAIDFDEMKNYRPVTNLQLLGKMIERVVGIRLDDHMDLNKLHSSKQYAYKSEHSAEMLMTKVTNDLLIACDRKTPTLVMFLDLSAAFDTVDQDKLLQILHDDIGVRGVALKWFDSFLRGRTQKVKIGDEYSAEEELPFGVAQGSILGPKLFNIYTKPFPSQLKVISVTVEGYADDNQLMKKFNLVFQVEVLGEGIAQTFELIEKWMKENFLKLNCGKTQIMVVAPEGIQRYILINGTFINGKCIRFVDNAKNLGVYIDSSLTMNVQVQKVVSSCFCTIRLLSRIKFFLTSEELQIMVCSLILSVMDYCNSVYYGMSKENMDKLQRVQNCAARLACKVNSHDRIETNELFHSLHWLKVRERVIFKVLVIVHKCVYGNAPEDLCNLVRLSQRNRLRMLEVGEHHGAMGERAFSVGGPRLWNFLPTKLRMAEEIDDFKSNLKTYLFKNSERFYELVHMQ